MADARVKRWSAKRNTEVVLRLLRGEELEEVSRDIQVPAHEIEDWRRVFLQSGSRGLKRGGRDPTERELVRTRAKVGELAMKLELAEHLLEKGSSSLCVGKLRERKFELPADQVGHDDQVSGGR